MQTSSLKQDDFGEGGHQQLPHILVSDFDGTMTRHDFFELVRREIPSTTTEDYWQGYLDGRYTHFQALAEIFAHARADEATLRRLAGRMELDSQLNAALSRLRRSGWQVVIASAGCEWYIRQLLQPVHVPVIIHANPGAPQPGGGLAMRLPDTSRFLSMETGIDKEAVVREAIAHGAVVAFAGNSAPDLTPALLVPPDKRFARGWLADHFREQQIPFRSFANWMQIADALARDEE